ncbi:MAG TPA: hypothetical protein VK404_00735 [Spirosoma sp.]|jgi:hypothetical protein|nr:hypothetical protein [Spirosoma sp.]
MKTILNLLWICLSLSLVNCTSQSEAEPQLETAFCEKARSYKDVRWLSEYIDGIKKNPDNIGTEVNYYTLGGQGIIEITIPVTSLGIDALFTCDGKSVDLKNDQEVQDFFKNRSNKTLVWLFN